MSGKYVIFGATGSIGSSLAEKLANEKYDIHLVARNQDEVKPIAEKLGCTFTVVDVLKDGLKILVYDKINHFCQWGTPFDLEEYNYWSEIFKAIN